MSRKALDEISHEIESAFSFVARNPLDESSNNYKEYTALFKYLWSILREKKSGNGKLSYTEFEQASVLWRNVDVAINDTLHDEILLKITHLFHYFPALERFEFTVTQKDPNDPFRPFIYKYTPFDCGKTSPFEYVESYQAKIGKGDIVLSFEGVTNGKSYKYEKGLNVSNVSFMDISDYAYTPFLILWEISNNWYYVPKLKSF